MRLLAVIVVLATTFGCEGPVGTQGDQGPVDIEGLVTNPGLLPIEGAVISIGEDEAVSDPSGAYRISGITQGEYDVVVTHEDYESYSAKMDLSQSRQHDFILPFKPFTISRVNGRVLSADGIPIAGATVTLDQGRVTTTNTEGSFKFDYLFAGSYLIEVVADGYQPKTQVVIVGTYVSVAIIVSLSSSS